MRKLLLTSLLLVTLPALGQAGTIPIVTPAACTNVADVWFKGKFGKGTSTLKNGRATQASFRAHYNAKLKLCLTRLEIQIAASGKSPAIDNITLYEGDPKAKKSRGAVSRVGEKITHCVLDGKKCATAKEWEALAAPLLKE